MAEAVAHDALAQDERDGDEQHRRDGSVDEEDPRPAEVRGQDAADEDADRRSAPRGCAPDAERDVAVAPLGEGRHEEREPGGREQRASQALEPAEGDERACGPGEPAEDRADSEER